MLQGPAAQRLHEEEVQTLISEAVEAQEAEHESELTQLRQRHDQEMHECQADVQESNRLTCTCCAQPHHKALSSMQSRILYGDMACTYLDHHELDRCSIVVTITSSFYAVSMTVSIMVVFTIIVLTQPWMLAFGTTVYMQ